MSNPQIVARATSYLRGLARRRNAGTVTADDVQNFLTRNNFRGTTNERLSVVRQVLRSPVFSNAGVTQSRREQARSRTITAWAPNN